MLIVTLLLNRPLSVPALLWAQGPGTLQPFFTPRLGSKPSPTLERLDRLISTTSAANYQTLKSAVLREQASCFQIAHKSGQRCPRVSGIRRSCSAASSAFARSIQAHKLNKDLSYVCLWGGLLTDGDANAREYACVKRKWNVQPWSGDLCIDGGE